MSASAAPATENEQVLARDSFRRLKNLFSVPAPVRALFDSVPVVTYAPNALPTSSPRPSRLPTLYVFAGPEDVAAGNPSFNPSCLRWQTFLKIAGIEHRLVSSNNHASPTGILPFLIPAVTPPPSSSSSSSSQPAPDAQLLPIPASKLAKYALDHGASVPETSSVRYEAYQSLLDHRVRSAWLHALYLSPPNFAAVATKLYITPSTSSPPVRHALSSQLQAAAEAELLKSAPRIDVDDLYAEADKAFEALSILLDRGEWFFDEAATDKGSGDASRGPTLFDASVFAYTHLLLDDRLRWRDTRLARCVTRRQNLVDHRNRLLERYWGIN